MKWFDFGVSGHELIMQHLHFLGMVILFQRAETK